LRPQSGGLFRGELEHEVLWEALNVAFDPLDKTLGINAIQLSQVLIEHHLASSHDEDPLLNRG
jgi:hypothetical protein